MSIKVHVQVDFYTGDLIEWIISKTGYDGKIDMMQYDKHHVPVDKEYAHSIYPKIPELIKDGYHVEYRTECPGIIIFTELGDNITSFVIKHQFSDEGLQHLMHTNCRTSRIYKAASCHLEVYNDVNIYYQDGIYLVFVDTTSLIRDFLHDKYPKDHANAFNDSFDLKFSLCGEYQCKFSASWIVSNNDN